MTCKAPIMVNRGLRSISYYMGTTSLVRTRGDNRQDKLNIIEIGNNREKMNLEVLET